MTVTVTADRPLGTAHPDYPDMIYPVNYGYVKGVFAGDGEEQDAYIIGVEVPVSSFTGKLCAVIHRKNDCEDKWVVCPHALCPTIQQIKTATFFTEQYFDSEIELL